MNRYLEINTHLTWGEFKNFNLSLWYRKPAGIFLTIIGIGMLLLVLIYPFAPSITSGKFPLTQLIFGLSFTLLLPYWIYRSAKKNYDTNSRINENITYKFDTEWIEIKGESFDAKLTWNKINKVVETKSSFVIYTTEMTVSIVPKKDMSSEQIIELSNMIKRIPNLKMQLLNQ